MYKRQAKTLFVNPPLVGDLAFTRQGRCQEREEVLGTTKPVSYTHLRAHETVLDLVCRLLLEKKKKNTHTTS